MNMANTTGAQLLENSLSTLRIGERLPSATRDLHVRLLHSSSTDVQSSSHPERSLHYRSSHSNSSMASNCSHRPSTLFADANTGPASLHQYSKATPDESLIALSQKLDRELKRRMQYQERTPIYECSFWFLSCSYISSDQDEWRVHCLSHFRTEEPPKSVQCPLCEEFSYSSGDGWTSWDYRQEHVGMHHRSGQSLRTSRPDFNLFQHLWQKRLIDDQDLKELKGGNHNLTQAPSNLITTGRCARDGRRQRRQHIGARRTLGQQITMASHNAVSIKQEREQPNLENTASMRAVFATAYRPETLANTFDAGQSTTEELEAATTLSHGDERIHTSRMGQEHAPHVPSQGETRDHHNLPSTSVSLGRVINGIADVSFHPSSTSENNQESYESDTDSLLCDSDLLEETSSSEHTPEEHLPGIISDTLKEEYFALLLHSFKVTQQPASTDATLSQDQSQGSSSASKGKRHAASPPNTDISQHWSSKRSRRRSPNKGDQDDDEEEEGSRRKAPGGTPPSREDNGQAKDLLFACPFVKRYPHRYLKCFSHSLKDISRVKQHLFRDKTHRLPIYCPNCSRTFESEDIRDEHIRDTQCAKRPLVKWEGITESQRRQLSKRSSSTRSPEENWYDVFRVLFPGEPLPSDPYIDMDLSGELRAFREHLLVEGPRIWNDFLTAQLPEHLRPYLEELQSLHDSFYAESVVRLCESWHSQRSPNSSNDARRNRDYETNPDVVRASVAAPYLEIGSRIQSPHMPRASTEDAQIRSISTDAHSGYHHPHAAHNGHTIITPSSSIPQGNHPLPDHQSVPSNPPTSDDPTITNPPQSLEVSLYPEAITPSIGRYFHMGDIVINPSIFGDTSDGVDATSQSVYPSQEEPPSFSSPLAQSQTHPKDIFGLVDFDRF